MKTRAYIEELLSRADISINGSRPWDLQLHQPKLLNDILARGNLGLGEGYMRGDWDCDQLDEFFYRVLRAQLNQQIQPTRFLWHHLKARLLNLQSRARAFQVGKQHYDLGNKLYQAMLDERMVYTCGYWQHADNLADAQRDKLELICKKLQLRPGMQVLDIGCGWGSFMKYAAENYGVRCVGVTVSKAQVELGEKLCDGLPIEFRLKDYREITERFDAVVSIGMFEHVGQKNYDDFMDVAARSLKDEGLFLLHTIGRNRDVRGTDPWINRYIFPNGELPSLTHIDKCSREHFIAEDIHNIGADYDRTLMAWGDNFERHWEQLKDDYDTTFKRMWRYYLRSCAGAFRARDLQVWQWVFSKKGLEGGYHRPTLD